MAPFLRSSRCRLPLPPPRLVRHFFQFPLSSADTQEPRFSPAFQTLLLCISAIFCENFLFPRSDLRARDFASGSPFRQHWLRSVELSCHFPHHLQSTPAALARCRLPKMMAVGSSSSTGNGSVCFLVSSCSFPCLISCCDMVVLVANPCDSDQCRQSLAVGENGRHKSRVCFQAGHFATPIVLFRKVASTAWFNGCLTEDVDRAITVQTIRHRDSKLLPPAMPLRVRLAQSSLREPRQFPIETGGSDAYQTMLAPPYVLRSRASAEVAVIEALFINTEEWVVGAGRPYDSIYRRMERPSVRSFVSSHVSFQVTSRRAHNAEVFRSRLPLARF